MATFYLVCAIVCGFTTGQLLVLTFLYRREFAIWMRVAVGAGLLLFGGTAALCLYRISEIT